MATGSSTTHDIEAAVEEELDLPISVEEDSGRLIITGEVESEEMRQAVLDIAARLADGTPIDAGLDIMQEYADQQGEFDLSEADVGDMRGSDPDLEEDEALEAGDFTDQETMVDPDAASGASRSSIDPGDDGAEGDETYTPPNDPVGTDTEVIGGFSNSSTDSVEVERSSDGRLGDEGIEDAVRRELHEDAATNPLDIEVSVRGGIVTLRGRVQTMDDAENAQSVAARVPGVRDVADETQVEGGYMR